MYTETKKLKVSCPTNLDYNAVFNKEDIKKEMKEIGLIGNWIEYVLDHMFDNEPECTDDLLNIFALYNLRKATLQFGDDYVTIEKIK